MFCQFRERRLTDEGKKLLIKIYIKYLSVVSFLYQGSSTALNELIKFFQYYVSESTPNFVKIYVSLILNF